MKRKCNKAGLHFKHFRQFQKAELCTRLLGARAGIRWPLQTHSSPVILWEDKHTGRCKSYMKSVTPGPLVGPYIQFWFCTVGEEGSMNNCQLFWYWQWLWYFEDEMENKLNETVAFQYFLSELQGALKIGILKIAAISERIKQCWTSLREILLDMAVQNVVGD